MSAAAPPSWLEHPLGPALLRFSSLPSEWLHPSRADEVPQALQGAASLHRHRSVQLAREHRLDPVTAFADPALAIALLPPDRFDRLLRFAGIVLLAVGVRRTIARAPLAQLREQLGDEGLNFARAQSFRLQAPAIEEHVRADDAREQCEHWGAALVALAMDDAMTAVGRRTLLRLPAQLDAEAARIRRAGLAPAQALALLLELLQMLETEWLSSFPAAR